MYTNSASPNEEENKTKENEGTVSKSNCCREKKKPKVVKLFLKIKQLGQKELIKIIEWDKTNPSSWRIVSNDYHGIAFSFL